MALSAVSNRGHHVHTGSSSRRGSLDAGTISTASSTGFDRDLEANRGELKQRPRVLGSFRSASRVEKASLSSEERKAVQQIFHKNLWVADVDVTLRPPEVRSSKLTHYKEGFWKEVDQHAKLSPDKKRMARAIFAACSELTARMRKDKKSVSQSELETFAAQVTNYFGIDFKQDTKKAATKYPWVNIPSNLIGLGATYAAATSPPPRALGLMASYVAVAFIPLFVAHTFVFQAQFRSMKNTAKVTSDSVKTMPLREVAKELPRATQALEHAIDNVAAALTNGADTVPQDAIDGLKGALEKVRNLVGEAVTIDAKYLIEKEATGFTTVVRKLRALGAIGAAITGIMLRDPVMGAHVLSAVVAGQIVGQVYASFPDTARKQDRQAELSLRAFDPFVEAGIELPESGEATDEQLQKFMYTLGRKMFAGEMEQRVALVEKGLAEMIRKDRQQIGLMMNKSAPDSYIRMRYLQGKSDLNDGETAELARLRGQFAAACDADSDGRIIHFAERANRIEADMKSLRDRGGDWENMSDESKKVVSAEFDALGDSLGTLKRVFSTGFQNLGQPEMSVPLAINKVVQTLTLVFGGPSTPQLAGALSRYFELPAYWAAAVVGILGLAALYGAGFGPLANTHTVAMRSDLLDAKKKGTLDLLPGWRGLPRGAKLFIQALGAAIFAQVNVDRRLRSVDKHARRAGQKMTEAEEVLTRAADTPRPATDAGSAAEPPVMRGALPPSPDPGYHADSDNEPGRASDSDGSFNPNDRGLEMLPDRGAGAAFALGASRGNNPPIGEVQEHDLDSTGTAGPASEAGPKAGPGDASDVKAVDEGNGVAGSTPRPGPREAEPGQVADKEDGDGEVITFHPRARGQDAVSDTDTSSGTAYVQQPSIRELDEHSEAGGILLEREGDVFLPDDQQASPAETRGSTPANAGSIMSPEEAAFAYRGMLTQDDPATAHSHDPAHESQVIPAAMPPQEAPTVADIIAGLRQPSRAASTLDMPGNSRAASALEGLRMVPPRGVSSGFEFAVRADLGRAGLGRRPPSSVYIADNVSEVSSLRDSEIIGDSGHSSAGAAGSATSSVQLPTQEAATADWLRSELNGLSDPDIQLTGLLAGRPEVAASAPAADTQKKRNWKDIAFGKWRRKDGNTAEASQEQGREKAKTMRALLKRIKSKPAPATAAEGAQSGKRKPNVLQKPRPAPGNEPVDLTAFFRNRSRTPRQPAAPASEGGTMAHGAGDNVRKRDRFLAMFRRDR